MNEEEMSKTKIQFRIKKSNGEYVKGWEEATKRLIGIGNDPTDETLLSIAFDDGTPDNYDTMEVIRQ